MRDIFKSEVQARAPFNTPRAPRAEDMRGTERAEQGMVKALTKLAQAGIARELAKSTTDEAYKTQAREAYNKMRDEVNKVRSKFKTTQLSGAADSYPDYKKQIQNSAEKYNKNLAPEAQKIYKSLTTDWLVGVEQESQDHLAREFVKTKRFNAAQDVDLTVQEAMLNPYDKNSLLKVASALYNQAEIEGGTAGITEDETWGRVVDQKTAQRYSAFLAQHLSYLSDRPGDGNFAAALYEENKQYMTQADRQKAEPKVREAAFRQTGQEMAGEIFNANPEEPAKGYSKILQIANPDLQRATLTEFQRMIEIDKQNTAVNRATTWGGFHDLLDQVEPGSADLQTQVNNVKSYISNISDKMDRLGGPTTLKQQMLDTLDKKIKPSAKVSDPVYLAELNNMTNDVPQFSVMDIDHSRLAPADSRRFLTIQQNMQKGDAQAIKKIRSANQDYYGVIRDVLVAQGIFASPEDANAPEAKGVVNAISSEFVGHLTAIRDAYGTGPEFLDPNTISNINANKQILKERLESYVKDLKETNPDLTMTKGRFWDSRKDVKKLRDSFMNREFTPVPIPARPKPSTFAPPATRTQRQGNASNAKKFLESLEVIRKAREKRDGSN